MSFTHCPNCGEPWQGHGTACVPVVDVTVTLHKPSDYTPRICETREEFDQELRNAVWARVFPKEKERPPIGLTAWHKAIDAISEVLTRHHWPGPNVPMEDWVTVTELEDGDLDIKISPELSMAFPP